MIPGSAGASVLGAWLGNKIGWAHYIDLAEHAPVGTRIFRPVKLRARTELTALVAVYALAGDTDGVDGAEEVAGAVVTPDTLARAAERGVNAKAALANNDGHGFFEALGDQVITGPTLTNVNDFRAVLVLPQSEERAAVRAAD